MTLFDLFIIQLIATLGTTFSIVDTNRHQNLRAAARHREIADLLEHLPPWFSSAPDQLTITPHQIRTPGPSVWNRTNDQNAALLTSAVRALSNLMPELRPDWQRKKLSTTFSTGLEWFEPGAFLETMRIMASRDDVCEMIEVGVEEVTVYDVPDEVKEQYARIDTKPKVEVRCRPLFKEIDLA